MLQLDDLISEAKTIREVLIACTKYLEEHSIGEAKENAELLFLHITQWNKATLLMHRMDLFQAEWIPVYREAISRKAKGEPLQYITGEQYFYGRKFLVNKHVLIPRPETEILVEAIIKHIQVTYPDRAITVLDVGTGSGAIAISLKAALPHINVIASDISPDALHTAKQNAIYHDLDVTFVEGDLLKPFITTEALQYSDAMIDVVVSNPPYIPDGEKDSLQIEVQQYEPHLALFGGVDGLYPYQAMLAAIEELKNPPSLIGFELGIHQPAIVAKLMEQQGIWTKLDIIKDYNGIDRHIIAVKK